MTQALAQDFRDRGAGLYADRAHSYAPRVRRAARAVPRRPLEGEFLDVMRQAARWLERGDGSCPQLLGDNPARNLLAAAVDFGEDGSPAEQPPAPRSRTRMTASSRPSWREARQADGAYLTHRK